MMIMYAQKSYIKNMTDLLKLNHIVLPDLSGDRHQISARDDMKISDRKGYYLLTTNMRPCFPTCREIDTRFRRESKLVIEKGIIY